MFGQGKINLAFKHFYGKNYKITDYIKEGDEIIIKNYKYFYFRVKVIHIYAGVVFYNIVKRLRFGTTEWKDILDNNIYHFDEDSIYALQCYPTEINLFDWFNPSILKIYKPDTLCGAIKINYEGKFKNDPEELILKEN